MYITLIISNIALSGSILTMLAYIDPGTGSIILQAIVASVVGAAIAVKLFWHRILKVLGLRKGNPGETENPTSDPSEKP